jgi:hypothetical protein
MDSIYPLLVFVHGAAGALALATYWLAAGATKGGRVHRAAGSTYLAVMLAVVATAVPMAVQMALAGRPGIATFLAYLVVITATPMWLGRRAVRMKRDQAGYRAGAYPAVAVINIAVGLGVHAVGWALGQALLIGFSLIGVVIGVNMLRKRRTPVAHPRWWMQEHYGAMLGCGVATHIAFLAIGSNRLLAAFGITAPSWFGLMAWFVPVLVSVLAGLWLDRRYLASPALRTQAPVSVAPARG